MLQPGKAVKVTIYLSDGATHHGVPLYSSILDFLFYRGVAGATVTKGIAGFGADHHMHAAHLVEISDRLPIKIEFIESREKVESLLGKLEDLAGSGLKDKPLLHPHHGSIMLSAIDTAEKLRAFLPIVDQMVEEGLVVFSDVDIIKYAYRALDAEKQPAPPVAE